MQNDAMHGRIGRVLKSGVIGICLCLGLALAACEDPAPIKIGFIGGLSGRSADIGEASRNAVQLAVADANRAGGINGRKLELLVRDDRNDPSVAATEVHNLHQEGVVAIIGPNNSSIAAGMLPVLNALKLVTVSPTVSSLVFAGLDDYFFRINWTTKEYAEIYAKYYAERGVLRVSAAFDVSNRVFSESWLNEFTSSFKKYGGELISVDAFDGKTPRGYSDTTDKLLVSNVDAILLVANSFDAAQLAQQIRKINSNILLIAAEWAASERLLFLGGSAIEGLEFVQSYNRSDVSEKYIRFRTAYMKQFQRDTGYASIAAHDAATMLFQALARTGEDRPLIDAIKEIGTVQGLQQSIAFNRFGDAQRRAYFVVVKDGKFKPL